jgi:hypothetical protein
MARARHISADVSQASEASAMISHDHVLSNRLQAEMPFATFPTHVTHVRLGYLDT